MISNCEKLKSYTIYCLLFVAMKYFHFCHRLLCNRKVFWWIFPCEYYESLQKLLTMNLFSEMKVKTCNSRNFSLSINNKQYMASLQNLYVRIEFFKASYKKRPSKNSIGSMFDSACNNSSLGFSMLLYSNMCTK